MDRRDFVKALSAGAGITLTKELTPLAEEANAVEVVKGKTYLVLLPECYTPDKCKEFGDWLREAGLDVIVVAGDLKLYEVSLKVKE